MTTRDFHPRGIGEVLDEAIAAIRANWRVLLVVIAIAILPFATAYTLVSSFYLRDTLETLGALIQAAAARASSPPQASPMSGVLYSLVSAMGLVYWLSRIYLSSTLYASAGPLLSGRPASAKEMLKAGGRGFFPLLAVDFAVTWLAGFAALITFPLLGVGGIVAWVLLSMAGPIVVIEGGIGKAFSRSAALVRRHFWRVLVLLVGAYLIAVQFESALATPVLIREIIFGAQQQSALTTPIAWGWKVFDGVLQGFAVAVTLPFMQLVTLLCYLDLRAREEGMDLIIRARALLAPAR